MQWYTDKIVIGKYHLGEYYTESIHEDFDALRNYFRTKEKLSTSLTVYHENIHFLQDIGTGFGCLASEIIRGRNEEILFKLRGLDGKINVKIPIKKHIDSIPESENKNKLIACISEYESWNEIVKYFFTSSYNKKIFYDFNLLPNDEKSVELASEIGTRAILEGVTSLFSLYYCSNFGGKFKNFYHQEMYPKLLPEYKLTFEYLSQTIFPFYQDIQIDKKLHLLFLLSDIALHIPPPHIIEALCKNGKNSFNDFVPGWRFFQCVQTINVLNLEFPDFSKEGYIDFVNKISDHPSLNWPSMESTTDYWISFLEEQKLIAYKDISIEWKLIMMKKRKEIPQLFSSFMDIYNTILGAIIEIPFLSKTKSYNWVFLPDTYLSCPNKLNTVWQIIYQKQFLNSAISQIFDEQANGKLICPFFDHRFLKCDKEKPDCKEGINTEEPLYNPISCIFSKGFELYFHLPISIFKTNN